MSDFQAFHGVTHPIVRLVDDWNQLLDHGLEKTPNYIIRKNGALYEAIDGSTGKIFLSNGLATTVINGAIGNLTAGRTSPETIQVKGDITITGAIEVPGYTVLDLRGCKLALAAASNDNMIEATGTSFVIKGGILDGVKASQASGNGIRVLGDSQRFWIGYGMKIINAKDNGIHIEGTLGHLVGVGTISGIDVEDSGGHGFYSGPYSGDHIFSSLNAGGNTGNGIGLSASGSNVITGCEIWNNGGNGIDIYSSDDNAVTGCRGDQNIGHGLRLYDSDKQVISGCKTYSNSKSGILFETTSIDNVIIGHHAWGNGEHGIVFSNVNHNLITGCLINGNNEHGISIYCSPENVVSGCNILNNGITGDYDGINVNDDALNYSYRNVITGNRIWDSQTGVETQRYGIYISAGDNYQLIASNNVNNNDLDGIVDQTANSKIYGNVGYITENSGSGSIVSASTSDIITHGCDYTPNAGDITITLTENPTNTPGAIWVDTITATEFTVNCENDPGASNLDFRWAVRKV